MEIIIIIKNKLFTAKFPLKIFAAIVILFLGFVTFVVTYKTAVDIQDFFKIPHILGDYWAKHFIALISFLITVATLVQSGPVIWEKLVYWGQVVDNYLVKIFLHKKYFLDECQELLEKIRDKLNILNREFQEFIIPRVVSHENTDNKAPIIINSLLQLRRDCYHVAELLKNEKTFDQVNSKRKNNLRIALSERLKQITDLLMYIMSVMARAL